MEFLRIALRDLRSIKREKTILIVLCLLFFVASFSSLVVVGLTLLYSPTGYSKAKIGLVGDAPIFSSIVHPIRYDSLKSALEGLVNGEIDALVVFNENTSETNYITVYLPKEDIKAIKATLYLRKKLMEYQDVLRKLRGIPTLNLKVYEGFRKIEVPEGYSLHFRFIYVMLIPLLAITTAIIISAFLIDSICEEVETKTLDVLLSAVEIDDVIAGKILATLLLAMSLTVFWIFMLMLNGIAIYNPALVLLISISVSLMMSAIALVISVFMLNREKSQLVFSIVVISIIMLMFSNPSSPIALLVRVSANSNYTPIEVFVYLGSSLMIVVSSLLVAKKRLNKSIGLGL